MTVAAGLFVPSPSVWWARGDGASSLRATAAAATTPSSTEVADPTPWRVDPVAPMPDLCWWASWPCGAALAAMVVLGCAAHPWRCDGLMVVSVAVGGVACARGWCGGALARRWWWWWCSSVGPAMAGSDSRSEVAEGARQLAAALGGGVGAGWRLLLAVLVLAGVYSGRNSGGGGGSGYRIWRSGGRIRPSLGWIWCSCGGSDYRRWCSAGHRRRFLSRRWIGCLVVRLGGVFGVWAAIQRWRCGSFGDAVVAWPAVAVAGVRCRGGAAGIAGPGGGHTSLLGLADACARAGAGGSGGVPSLSARPLLLLDGGHFVAVVGFHAGVGGRPFYAVLPHMILAVGAERSQRGRRPRRLRGCWSGALPQIRDLQGMGRCPRWTYTAAEGWFFGMWSGRRGCWRSFAAACVAGASTPSEWPRPVVWRRRLWCLAGTRHLDRRPCCGFFGRRPGDGDTCGCRSPR